MEEKHYIYITVHKDNMGLRYWKNNKKKYSHFVSILSIRWKDEKRKLSFLSLAENELNSM